MTTHTCKPDDPGLLRDECRRCAEHASTPMLLTLDDSKMEALWDKMVDVERHDGRYATGAEGEAGLKLYLTAVWIERFVGIDPWCKFSELRAGLLQLR